MIPFGFGRVNKSRRQQAWSGYIDGASEAWAEWHMVWPGEIALQAELKLIIVWSGNEKRAFRGMRKEHRPVFGYQLHGAGIDRVSPARRRVQLAQYWVGKPPSSIEIGVPDAAVGI